MGDSGAAGAYPLFWLLERQQGNLRNQRRPAHQVGRGQAAGRVHAKPKGCSHLGTRGGGERATSKTRGVHGSRSGLSDRRSRREAMGEFIELLKQPRRESVIWLDSHNYAGRLLAGGAPPWLEVAAFVAW